MLTLSQGVPKTMQIS